jgi:hypothetical protein
MPTRGKKLITLRDRLSKWADGVRKQASELPPGPEREALLKKASHAETAADLDEWAASPGLQPLK